METRTLIPAHNGVHAPRRKSITFHNHSNLRKTALHPSLYSIHSHKSGKVTLTEYSNHSEYTSHRDDVFAEIARHHASMGKQAGCECATCQS